MEERGAALIPGVEVLNDVVFTQVCLSIGDDDVRRSLDALRRTAAGVEADLEHPGPPPG